MVGKADLQKLGNEILNLIESYGIQSEMFAMNIRISKEEYNKLKDGFSESDIDLGTTIALATDKWSIQFLYPFLEVKSSSSQE